MIKTPLRSMTGAFALLIFTLWYSAASAQIITNAVSTGQRGDSEAISAADIQAGGFDEDVPFFKDRCHDSLFVPEWMKGLDYVLQNNDDKGGANNYVLTITVNADAHAFLLVDGRIRVRSKAGEGPRNMGWVLDDGWVYTGWRVALDEHGGFPDNCAGTNDNGRNQTYNVWTKAVAAGDFVIRRGDGNNFHSIVVGPDPAPVADDVPFAPNGWLRGNAWNFLFLDTDPNGSGLCDGGGAARMQGNWTAPFNIGEEDPRAGDAWDIDFAVAESNAWELTGLSDQVGDEEDPFLPTWTSVQHHRARTNQVPRGNTNGNNVRNEDQLDLNDYMNKIGDRSGFTAAGTGNRNDGVMSFATTYVENTTGTDQVINLCAAGDDSVQVWVNNNIAINWSRCGGSSGNCQQNQPWILPPGVSKITVGIWEGSGGYAMRFGVIFEGKRVSDADLNGEVPPIRLLGPGHPGDDLTGQITDPPPPEFFEGLATGGWIKFKGWNMLGTIDNEPPTLDIGSNNPGLEIMSRNWVAPHDLGLEDPKSGDVWDDLDFGGDLPSQEIFTGGLTAPGTWFSLDDLEAETGLDLAGFKNNDTQDYNALVDTINNSVIGPAKLGGRVPQDEVIMIATTYVRNNLEEDLLVDVLYQTDDAGQVWVNCDVVSNRVDGCCNVFTETGVTLVPGVNKIAILTFEGGGGFNARLGLRVTGEEYSLNSFDSRVTFLGTGVGDDEAVTPALGCIRRETDEARRDCPTPGPITVDLISPVAGDDVVEVTELISAPDPAAVEVTDLRNCEVVDTIKDNTYTNISSTGVDIQSGGDFCNFYYAEVAGDFDIAVEIVDYQHSTGNGSWGKWGLMARENLNKCARMIMTLRTGPNVAQGARTARRTVLGNNNGVDCNGGYSDGGEHGGVSDTPPYTRITRVGNAFTAWFSDTLPDDLTDNSQWFQGDTHTFADAPATMFVGMANSEHSNGGVDVQTIKFRFINGLTDPTASVVIDGVDNGDPPASAVAGPETIFQSREIVCSAPLNAYEAGEVGYTISPSDGVSINGNSGIAKLGQDDLLFGDNAEVGDFAHAHALGFDQVDGFDATFDDDTGVYTLTASGVDFWQGGEHGGFMYNEIAGDFQATVHITERMDPAPARWGKHGLMARYTCNDDSKYSLGMTGLPFNQGDPPARTVDNPRHQVRMRHFDSGGGSSEERPLPGNAGVSKEPVFLRMTRRGGYIMTEIADDLDANGAPDKWAFLGADSDELRPETLLVGMALTSHAGNNPGFVSFDMFEVTEPPAIDVVSLELEPVLADDFDESIGGFPDGSEVVVGNAASPCSDNGTPDDPADDIIWLPPIVNAAGRVQLMTDGCASRNNAIYFDTDGENLGDTGFIAEFDIYFTKPDVLTGDPNPADGAMFVVYEGDFASVAGLVGDNGGSMAYNRLGDNNALDSQLRKSFGVEFDLWNNGAGSHDSFRDPLSANNWGAPDVQYHMGIDFNNRINSAVTNQEFGVDSLPNIYDEAGVHAKVEYLSGPNLITVWVSGKNMDASDYEETMVLQGTGVDLIGDIALGFTAGTGGANFLCEVDNLSVLPLCSETPDTAEITGAPAEPVDGGTPVVLTAVLGGADGDASYDWAISGGSAAAIVVNPDDNSEATVTADEGVVTIQVTTGDSTCDDGVVATVDIEFVATGVGPFIRGDDNADGEVNISDPQFSLNWQFLGGNAPTCLAALDTNGDGEVNISDPQFSLNFQFLGGPPPPEPFPACGKSTDEDDVELGCDTPHPACDPAGG